MALDVAEALAYLHGEARVLHSDIKVPRAWVAAAGLGGGGLGPGCAALCMARACSPRPPSDIRC